MHDDPPSKTKRKQEMHALQALGKSLVELSDALLAQVPMPPILEEAVLAARRITAHEGRRRQIQYIGKIMRSLDAEPLRERLAALLHGTAASAARHQQLERWRERLLAEDDALTTFLAEYPVGDIQGLRTTIRNAKKEAAEGHPPHAFRELFRLLREATEAAPGASGAASGTSGLASDTDGAPD